MRNLTARFAALTIAALTVTALTGCGGTGADQFTGQTFNVSITSSDTYSPVDIVVPAGSKVQWTNNDDSNHTVTSDTNQQFLNSDLFIPSGLRPADKFQWIVPQNATSGTKYFYHCRFHGTAGNGTTLGTGMAGSITIQ
jgi:plastocyanin